MNLKLKNNTLTNNRYEFATGLAKKRQYIIVTDGYNRDGTNKYVIRKVKDTLGIKVGSEIVWCVSFTEPIDENCTTVSIEHIFSHSGNGRIYPQTISDRDFEGIYTPKCKDQLEKVRKRLAEISQILIVDMETCHQKVKRSMDKLGLHSHGTHVHTSERQITVSSNKSEENFIKALGLCAKFNRYNICIEAKAYMKNHSVEMHFQF